jgi:hypothetical protein
VNVDVLGHPLPDKQLHVFGHGPGHQPDTRRMGFRFAFTGTIAGRKAAAALS